MLLLLTLTVLQSAGHNITLELTAHEFEMTSNGSRILVKEPISMLLNDTESIAIVNDIVKNDSTLRNKTIKDYMMKMLKTPSKPSLNITNSSQINEFLNKIKMEPYNSRKSRSSRILRHPKHLLTLARYNAGSILGTSDNKTNQDHMLEMLKTHLDPSLNAINSSQIKEFLSHLAIKIYKSRKSRSSKEDFVPDIEMEKSPDNNSSGVEDLSSDDVPSAGSEAINMRVADRYEDPRDILEDYGLDTERHSSHKKHKGRKGHRSKKTSKHRFTPPRYNDYEEEVRGGMKGMISSESDETSMPSTPNNPTAVGVPSIPNNPTTAGVPSIPNNPTAAGVTSIPNNPTAAGVTSIPYNPTAAGVPSIPNNPTDENLNTETVLKPGDVLFAYVVNERKYLQACHKKMKEQDVGYLSVALEELCYHIANLNPVYLLEMMEGLKDTVAILMSIGHFQWLDEPMTSILLDVADSLPRQNLRYIKARASTMRQEVMERRWLLSADINQVLDFGDSMVYTTDGNALLDTLSDVNSYPNGLLKGKALTFALLQKFEAPFLRAYNTEILNSFVKMANQAFQKRFPKYTKAPGIDKTTKTTTKKKQDKPRTRILWTTKRYTTTKAPQGSSVLSFISDVVDHANPVSWYNWFWG